MVHMEGSALDKLLRAVAFDSEYSSECSDHSNCPFCYSSDYGWVNHDDDCPVTQARKLLFAETGLDGAVFEQWSQHRGLTDLLKGTTQECSWCGHDAHAGRCMPVSQMTGRPIAGDPVCACTHEEMPESSGDQSGYWDPSSNPHLDA